MVVLKIRKNIRLGAKSRRKLENSTFGFQCKWKTIIKNWALLYNGKTAASLSDRLSKNMPGWHHANSYHRFRVIPLKFTSVRPI